MLTEKLEEPGCLKRHSKLCQNFVKVCLYSKYYNLLPLVVVAKPMAFRRPALQVHNIPLRMLHPVHHPPHHISFVGEVPGCLLANDGQDPCDTAKNKDHHWLPLAGCCSECSTCVGHDGSGECKNGLL